MIMSDDIKIERLPTFGVPLDLKTIKRGRKSPLNDSRSEKLQSGILNGKGIKKRKRQLHKNQVIVMANRVLKFEKSTDRQKQVALDFIKKINDPEKHFLSPKYLIKINNYLSYKYGDKYLNCNFKEGDK